jgi:SAM-dependent methyltransferase
MDAKLISPSAIRGPHTVAEGTRPYPLGYSQGEFNRLEQQSVFFGDLTADVLQRAGIRRGMRVLDAGSGVGDVSLLAGRLVGPSGAVLGIERSAEAVETAKRRAAEGGRHWVRFAVTDIDAFSTEEKFDAVIGRLILMYLPDRTATLRRLCSHVRPGGVVAFQEIAGPLARSIPDTPLFERCHDWIIEAFEHAGLEVDMGGKLFSTYLAADLPAPQMISGGRVEGGPHSPVYDYVANTLRSLLPVMQRVGVASPAEVGIDTLADRLRQEAVECNACIMLPPLIGAWTHTPA